MGFKKPSKAIKLLTGALTLCVIFGAAFIGIYSIAAADVPDSADDDPNSANMETLSPSQPDNSDIDDRLEDMNNADDWRKASGGRVWHPQVFPVNVERMEDGEIVRLGEYTLSEGDRMWYYVFAEAGNGLQVGFARPDDELLNTTYYSVQTLRQESETQKCECIASFTFRPPVEPGTYVLFLRATDGALENVKGSISIGYKADAS